LIQNQPGQQSGSIEAQPAVRQNAMPLPDEPCAERRHGMQLGEIWQFLVADWEIDIKQMVRRGRNAVVKRAVEIDNRIHPVAICQSVIAGEMKRSPASST